MSMSNDAENKGLDHRLGVAEDVYSAGGRFLALFTADPTDAFLTANEVDTVAEDTAYARQPITFGAAVNGESLNSNAQTFPAVVYGTDGVPYAVTHIGVMSAISGGVLIDYAPLVATITRLATKSLTFEIGTIKVTQD